MFYTLAWHRMHCSLYASACLCLHVFCTCISFVCAFVNILCVCVICVWMCKYVRCVHVYVAICVHVQICACVRPCLLACVRAWECRVEREHGGLRRIAGYGVTVTRGAASAMMFTYSSLLVTMCRNIFSALRSVCKLHLFITISIT